MTGAQELELRRMTAAMWAALRRALEYPEVHDLRSARILHRRGFLYLNGRTAKLTDAGREAIARRSRP